MIQGVWFVEHGSILRWSKYSLVEKVGKKKLDFTNRSSFYFETFVCLLSLIYRFPLNIDGLLFYM